MSPELHSRRATVRYLDFSQRLVSAERMKRQRISYSEFLSWFAPKHYPCIFLDQRLKTRLFR